MRKLVVPKSIPNFVSIYSLVIAVGIGLSTIVSLIAQYIYLWQSDLILSQVLIGVSTIIAPFVVKTNEIKIAQILSIEEKISTNDRQRRQFVERIKNIENSQWANIFPTVIMLLGLFSLWFFKSPWYGWNTVAHNAFSIFVVGFFLVAGSLGWQYIFLAMLLHLTRDINIKVNIFTWPSREIKKFNKIVIEIYLAGVLIYIGAILGVWALPWGQLLLTNDNLFTRMWVFPIALIVTGYFFVIQYFMHCLLSSAKERRLEKLDKKIEFLLEDADTVLSEKIKAIGELVNLRKIIEAESEWPLNIPLSLGVISSVIIPTIGSVSDFFLKYFKPASP
ncbi:MAG: hypothetical protein ACOYZ8_01600 [Chloroflexota bacterium]